jgi:hypothetical protein
MAGTLKKIADKGKNFRTFKDIPRDGKTAVTVVRRDSKAGKAAARNDHEMNEQLKKNNSKLSRSDRDAIASDFAAGMTKTRATSLAKKTQKKGK